MDKMSIAPALEKEPVTKPSTFIMGEGSHGFEPNGSMIATQLRSMQENIAAALGSIGPDSNLEPWVASKVSEASQSLTAISDYLKHGEKD
jgi:hypothetical protein